MAMTILVCRCGRKIQAPGARPGRIGRCPSCGGRLEVAGLPVEPAPAPPRREGDSSSSTPLGYALDPQPPPRPEPKSKGQHPTPDTLPTRAPSGGAGSRAEVFEAAPDQAEAGLIRVLGYPLRSAEPQGFAALIGCAFWALAVLVPEYCLTLWDDSNNLGTPLMGMLIILISAIPAAVLLPLIFVFFLQYLGRILVSSARGDTHPPRTPDRNFEGFTAGLGPWLVWLTLGLSVATLPLWLTWTSAGGAAGSWVVDAAVLLGVTLPYAAVALMLAFLHENPLAANPFSTFAALLRHGTCFVPMALKLAAIATLLGVAVALALVIRAWSFWLYLPFALACSMLAIWLAMATSRLLGQTYFRHHQALAWNHHEPRWGVRWRI